MVEDLRWRHEMSHQRFVAARPEVVWRALTELRLVDVPAARVLFWLRRLPGYLAGTRSAPPRTPLLDVARARGSALTFDEPNLVEIGRIGRFWQLIATDGPAVSDWAGFTAFAEPGYAKAIVSIALVPRDSGTLVVTTTRITATDEQAQRRFAAYWRVIRIGSGATRRALLSAVDRRASARTA